MIILPPRYLYTLFAILALYSVTQNIKRRFLFNRTQHRKRKEQFMEEKELDPVLDFSDLIYDYENRVPCISGVARMEQDFVPAEFVVKG